MIRGVFQDNTCIFDTSFQMLVVGWLLPNRWLAQLFFPIGESDVVRQDRKCGTFFQPNGYAGPQFSPTGSRTGCHSNPLPEALHLC